MPKVALIVERTGNSAERELEKKLNGADPRDVGSRLVGKRIELVVRLKGAKGVGVAKGSED